jgi:hypothetical protein
MEDVMNGKRNAVIGAILLTSFATLAVVHGVVARAAAAQAKSAVQAPRFEVDPFWPKPLPNHWLLGSTIGVWVDSTDHVWIIHRSSATLDATERGAEVNPPLAECCKGAPPVLEFDQAGNLVSSWGGPGAGYEWPQSNHGIFADHKNNIWIGGNGGGDSHILKFTKDGRFLAQFGEPDQPQNSHDPRNFSRVAKVTPDPVANEVYVADGYGNHRVAVLDMTTGVMKRYWGAYGNPPDDEHEFLPRAGGFANQEPDTQFRNPVHCADPSTDRFV